MKLFLSIGLSLFIIISCGKRISKTYVQDQKNVLRAYYAQLYGTALNEANKFAKRVAKKHKQDVFVALLERGKIALDAGRYDVAIKDLQRAEKRFIDIEGTISIKEEASSLFLDDTTKEYEAEPLEKIMISPYLALAYWLKGDFSGARIERNRTINKINQYIETKAGSAYLENPFARYLSAIIYENEQKFQDAKIEYRKIAKVRPFTKAAMNNEIKRIDDSAELSDLVVFLDLGKSPIKHERRYKGGGMRRGKSIYVSIVYAKFLKRKYFVKKARILIDGQAVGTTNLLYDLGPTILTQYKKNLPKLRKTLIARAIIKIGTQAAGNTLMKSKNRAAKATGAILKIFGAVTSAIERADLRSWLSLPAEIHVHRSHKLEPGKHTLQLEYLDAAGGVLAKSPVKQINIDKGKIKVAYFRVVK